MANYVDVAQCLDGLRMEKQQSAFSAFAISFYRYLCICFLYICFLALDLDCAAVFYRQLIFGRQAHNIAIELDIFHSRLFPTEAFGHSSLL